MRRVKADGALARAVQWVEVPSCGACTATVAGLKLVTPAIEPTSSSMR